MNIYSRSSCYLEAYKDNKYFHKGTGFFLVVKDNTYFITNNHIIGGEFANLQHTRDHGHALPADSIPNNLIVCAYGKGYDELNVLVLPLNDGIGTSLVKKFYEVEGNDSTLMDVIAIKLSKELAAGLSWTTVFKEQNYKENLHLNMGDDLYLIGFPMDWATVEKYPIWKKCSVATEANLTEFKKEFFFVDGTGRPGMSGSPVLQFPDTKLGVNDVPALCGVYATQAGQLEIGRIWKIGPIIRALEK